MRILTNELIRSKMNMRLPDFTKSAEVVLMCIGDCRPSQGVRANSSNVAVLFPCFRFLVRRPDDLAAASCVSGILEHFDWAWFNPNRVRPKHPYLDGKKGITVPTL